MPAATANRLLPLFAALVLLILFLVTAQSCAPSGEGDVVLQGVPVAPAPDADTPADTIKTLTANVAAMTAEVEALRKDNASLARENRNLVSERRQIEDNVATRLRRELQARERDEENQSRLDASVLSSLNNRIDRLAQSVAEAQARTSSSNSAGEMPIGLGLGGAGASVTPDAWVWISPLDAGPAGERSALPTGSGMRRSAQRLGLPPGTLRWTGGEGSVTDDPGAAAMDGRPYTFGPASEATQGARTARLSLNPGAAAASQPAYTVPRNATLIGATAMTALVGRIPFRGEVRDPMPFKVITGADNLAANGLSIPGVHGMIWSGTAVGDWTLSCVTGRLESVTFVFDDGTIRTLSSDDPSLQQAGQGQRNLPLGWISDQQGIPCIGGERKSNAAAFLSQRIGVTAVQAAGEAAAAAQAITVLNNAGGLNGAVTGEVGPFVLGRTIAGGSEEVARWLLERQAQSFDAVFVPAGIPVAIHVDRELTIDFDPQGRRLDHARPTAAERTRRLD
jgi:integrating conjugative element protein (TIGR03752 family)